MVTEISPNGKVRFKRSYRKWTSMLRRCNDQNHPAWKHYGGRGIKVCDRWSGHDGYANFVADLGEPPEGLTLQRINNDKGYSPENCKWATWLEQASNRRHNSKPVDPGCLRQRSLAAGLPYHVVYQRVKMHFWPLDKALSTPVLNRGRQPGQTGTYSKFHDGRILPLPAITPP